MRQSKIVMPHTWANIKNAIICMGTSHSYPLATRAVSSLSEGSRSREESARLTTMDERSEQLERLQPALGESGEHVLLYVDQCRRCGAWSLATISVHILLGDIPEDPLLAETHYSQVKKMAEN